jgi:hypothetical protein
MSNGKKGKGAGRARRKKSDHEIALRRRGLEVKRQLASSPMKQARATILSALRAAPSLTKKGREGVKARLLSVFAQAQILPAELGLRNLGELADAVIRTAAKFYVRKYTLAELIEKKRGLKGVIGGALTEQIVDQNPEANAILGLLAKDQLAEMNYLVDGRQKLMPGPKTGTTIDVSGLLINATGEEATLASHFGEIQSAYDVEILDQTGKVLQFIDRLKVSFAREGKNRVMTPLTEIEIKKPRAARDLPKQVDSAPSRWAEAAEVRFRTRGQSVDDPPHVFAPKSIIFSGRSAKRIGITPSWEASEQVRFRFDPKGYGEAVLQIDFRVNSAVIDAVTDVLLP